MKKANIIIVYNKDGNKILTCYRKKAPYKGLYNLVGGKKEDNETIEEGAYRELEEETGITRKNIQLYHFMDFLYYKSNLELEVFVGKLDKEIELIEEVNPLSWIDIDENFFDSNKYAGDGNIGHMINTISNYKDEIFS